MNMNRRKFLRKSLLLGGSVSLATYALSKTTPLVIPKTTNKATLVSATYANTAQSSILFKCKILINRF